MNTPTPAIGDPVRVHKNLNTGTWSLQVKVKGKGWRVACHPDRVTLRDAIPVCSAAGAARIRARSRRAVVASISGILVSIDQDHPIQGAQSIHYNPFRSDDFTYQDGTTYTGSTLAHFPSACPSFQAI